MKRSLGEALKELQDLKASWVIRQMQPSLLVSCQAAIKGMGDTVWCETLDAQDAVEEVVKQIKDWKKNKGLHG